MGRNWIFINDFFPFSAFTDFLFADVFTFGFITGKIGKIPPLCANIYCQKQAGPKQLGAIPSILLCSSLTSDFLTFIWKEVCQISQWHLQSCQKTCLWSPSKRCPSREKGIGLLWSSTNSGNREMLPEREGNQHPTSPFILKLQKYSRRD